MLSTGQRVSYHMNFPCTLTVPCVCQALFRRQVLQKEVRQSWGLGLQSGRWDPQARPREASKAAHTTLLPLVSTEPCVSHRRGF